MYEHEARIIAMKPIPIAEAIQRARGYGVYRLYDSKGVLLSRGQGDLRQRLIAHENHARRLCGRGAAVPSGLLASFSVVSGGEAARRQVEARMRRGLGDHPKRQELEMYEAERPDVLRTGVAAAGRSAAQRAIRAAFLGRPLTAEKVCWVQVVLTKAEQDPLAPDGIFGPLTRAAVQRFQARHGLVVDGIVGPQTDTALTQAAINQIRGASLLPVNGVPSPATRQEVVNFQRSKGLIVDGIVGPQTRAAMIAALGCACRTTTAPVVPPTPPPVPVVPGCDQVELARRVNACIEESKRCLIQAGEDLALAMAACAATGMNPVCVAAATGKALLDMGRCRDALLRCDQAAKAATGCQ